MLQSTREADVVIVGAGVAGLSAAHRLAAAGVTTLVLEAAPFVGGRMATEKVDGFRLDRIGQLLSTAYPELRLTPGLDSLVLRPFAPGVLLHCAGVRHHVPAPRRPGGAQGAPSALLPAQGAPEGGTEGFGGAGDAEGAGTSGGAGGPEGAGGTGAPEGAGGAGGLEGAGGAGGLEGAEGAEVNGATKIAETSGNTGNTGDTGGSGDTGDTGRSGHTMGSGGSGGSGDTGGSRDTGGTGGSGGSGGSKSGPDRTGGIGSSWGAEGARGIQGAEGSWSSPCHAGGTEGAASTRGTQSIRGAAGIADTAGAPPTAPQAGVTGAAAAGSRTGAAGAATDPAALWDAPVPGRGVPFTRAALVRAAAVRAAGMRAARARVAGDPRGVAAGLARITGTLSRLGVTPVDRVLERPELPAGQAFLARGIPAGTVDGFLRPLLAALLCDPDLTTSSRCADVALRAYARGLLCVPEGGAEVLPELLARSLPPDTVRTGVRVTSVSTNKVTTAQHGEFRCRAVLLATDARAAAELLPGLRVPEFHPVTVVHHAVDEPPETGARLLLDADREGPVAHTAVVSHVDPTRAPAGRTLVSSTVLGPPPDDVDNAVRAHLARLYGMSTARWETLAVHHCAEAVPAMRPPHDPRRPVRLLAGLYVCGDHRDASSVQGALHSAHRAARAVLKDLGLGPMHRAEPQPSAA